MTDRVMCDDNSEGQSDERRGDGYMNAWQPVLTQVPWVPVVLTVFFFKNWVAMAFCWGSHPCFIFLLVIEIR